MLHPMTEDRSGKALRVLQLESANDAKLAIQVLRDAGMMVTSKRVSTEAAFKKALQAFSPDFVLCDVRLKSYSGFDALIFTIEHYPVIPVIILTEDIEDGDVAKLLELGAKDYVRKGRLARLPFTVRRVVQERQRIIEHRHTEESLELFRALLDHSDDAVEIVDMATMQFVDVNDGACRALGYTRKELLSMTVSDIDPKFEANRDAMLIPIKEHGEGRFESVHRRKDGSLFPVELAVKTIKLDKLYGLSISRDITERKQAERSLYLFRALLDQSDDAIEIIEPGTARFIDVNEGACRELGYGREELLSMTVADIDPEYAQHPESARLPLKRTRQHRFETVHRRKDGSSLPVEISLKNVEYDGGIYGLAITHDITERKQTEHLLTETVEKYQNLVENSPALIYSYSLKRGGIFYSQQVAKALGYSMDKLYRDPFLWANSIHPEDRGRVAEVVKDIKIGSRFEIEYRIKSAHGSWIWLLDRSIAIREDKDGPIVDGIAIDLSERKQAEQERQNLLHNIRLGTSELETVFVTQTDVILLYDQDLRVSRSTPQFKRDYGFDPTGIHLRDILVRVACRRLNNHPVIFSNKLPSPMALLGKHVQPKPFKVTHADGTDAIVEASSTPLYVDGSIQGVVSVWHDVTELRKATDDIATYAKQLEKAMLGTLKAVANMVEQRDPYTAGHERRVGLIAADIAREMDWPEAQCKALELIGLVHDIGKIGVPVEILSKPIKLSDTEYQLMKAHAENGYNILRDIEFPFPVAEIVYQHHERMDGSGYPRGLKGDDILPEARILAVADVLESMSSHRPYRPARGIDAALDELQNNRGSLYDPATVDALLRLITKKDYQLPEAG